MRGKHLSVNLLQLLFTIWVNKKEERKIQDEKYEKSREQERRCVKSMERTEGEERRGWREDDIREEERRCEKKRRRGEEREANKEQRRDFFGHTDHLCNILFCDLTIKQICIQEP